MWKMQGACQKTENAMLEHEQLLHSINVYSHALRY